jgi:hypothetical protein
MECGSYDPDSLSAVLLKTALARVPTDVIAVRHTMTISDNITAYSTAVGPSSQARKRCNFSANDFIVPPPLQLLGSIEKNMPGNKTPPRGQFHWRRGGSASFEVFAGGYYDPASLLAVLLNTALALVPMEVIAVKHTITIRANMTAYSTAVGPSSEARKRCTF